MQNSSQGASKKERVTEASIRAAAEPAGKMKGMNFEPQRRGHTKTAEWVSGEGGGDTHF